jgi:hypothetical protein
MARRWRSWATPLTFFVVAVAWTWPALITADVLGRNPDGLGTGWFVETAPRWIWTLHDDQTGFPEGVDYGRPDSFMLALISTLLQAFPPARVLGWVHVFGVTASAWAAERFARELGARAPWSLLAGFSFAFCGLASTALIEGYAYHTFNPWLPLMAAWWWRATSGVGRASDGALAGLFFLLTLFTTAWLGFSGALIIGGFLGAAILRRGSLLRIPPLAAALGTVALPLAAYVLLFHRGGTDTAPEIAGRMDAALQMRLSLVRLAGPTLSTDMGGHSQTAWPQSLAIGLVAVSPIVLRNVPGWRRVMVVGLVGLSFSFAPSELGKVLPEVVANNLMKFPERLGWAWALCGGAVAARAATAVASPSAAGLFLVALFDAFFVLRQPFRQVTAIGAAPSAYRAQAGPVLDWWPENLSATPVWVLRTTNTDCWYQAQHGRPIADHCIFTPGVESPRIELSQQFSGAVFAGRAQTAAGALAALGFTTVAVHADLFSEGDRLRIEEAMKTVDPKPDESRDGGEHLIAYSLVGRR